MFSLVLFQHNRLNTSKGDLSDKVYSVEGDIVDTYDQNNIGAHLGTTDIKKVFDSLDH